VRWGEADRCSTKLLVLHDKHSKAKDNKDKRKERAKEIVCGIAFWSCSLAPARECSAATS
jgi:hypothetical protein